jgi:hypothetical protein
MKWLNEKGDPCEPPSVVVGSCGLGRDLPHQLDELCRQLRVVRILRVEHSLAQHLDVMGDGGQTIFGAVNVQTDALNWQNRTTGISEKDGNGRDETAN